MYIKKFWYGLKYWQRGLLTALILLVIGFILLILKLSINYDGYCSIGFGSSKCPLITYLYTYSLIIFFSSLFVIILPLLIICTLIGYIMDKYKK